MKNKNQILDDALSSAERVQFEKLIAQQRGLFWFYIKLMFGAVFLLIAGFIAADLGLIFKISEEAVISISIEKEKFGNAATGFVFACILCLANYLSFDFKSND